MNKIVINGIELELDMLDATQAEIFEAEIEKLQASIDQKKSLAKSSQAIREICADIFACFNALFGDGTDERIFEGTCNLRVAMAAFAELVTQARQKMDEDLTSITSKYTPNRAARRASKNA